MYSCFALSDNKFIVGVEHDLFHCLKLEIYLKSFNFNLKDKVILVTGANGQLGLSLVKHLMDEKAKVIATDCKLDKIKLYLLIIMIQT